MTDGPHDSTMPSVAIVSADRRVRDGLASLLAAGGQALVMGPVDDAAAALELLETQTPDAVVVDLRIASDGEQGPLLEALRRLAPHTRLLAITWDGEHERGVGRGIVDAYVEADGRSPAMLETVLREALPAD